MASNKEKKPVNETLKRTIVGMIKDLDHKYFDDALRLVPIEISSTLKTAGKYAVVKSKKEEKETFVFRYSPLFLTGKSTGEQRDSLLHEMIHGYLHLKHDCSLEKHDEIFLRKYIKNTHSSNKEYVVILEAALIYCISETNKKGSDSDGEETDEIEDSDVDEPPKKPARGGGGGDLNKYLRPNNNKGDDDIYDYDDSDSVTKSQECPICNKKFSEKQIQRHVNECLAEPVDNTDEDDFAPTTTTTKTKLATYSKNSNNNNKSRPNNSGIKDAVKQQTLTFMEDKKSNEFQHIISKYDKKSDQKNTNSEGKEKRKESNKSNNGKQEKEAIEVDASEGEEDIEVYVVPHDDEEEEIVPLVNRKRSFGTGGNDSKPSHLLAAPTKKQKIESPVPPYTSKSKKQTNTNENNVLDSSFVDDFISDNVSSKPSTHPTSPPSPTFGSPLLTSPKLSTTSNTLTSPSSISPSLSSTSVRSPTHASSSTSTFSSPLRTPPAIASLISELPLNKFAFARKYIHSTKKEKPKYFIDWIPIPKHVSDSASSFVSDSFSSSGPPKLFPQSKTQNGSSSSSSSSSASSTRPFPSTSETSDDELLDLNADPSPVLSTSSSSLVKSPSRRPSSPPLSSTKDEKEPAPPARKRLFPASSSSSSSTTTTTTTTSTSKNSTSTNGNDDDDVQEVRTSAYFKHTNRNNNDENNNNNNNNNKNNNTNNKNNSTNNSNPRQKGVYNLPLNNSGKSPESNGKTEKVQCPFCDKYFPQNEIEEHCETH